MGLRETQAQPVLEDVGIAGSPCRGSALIKSPVNFTLSAQLVVILRVGGRFKNPFFFPVPVMKSSTKLQRQSE